MCPDLQAMHIHCPMSCRSHLKTRILFQAVVPQAMAVQMEHVHSALSLDGTKHFPPVGKQVSWHFVTMTAALASASDLLADVMPAEP